MKYINVDISNALELNEINKYQWTSSSNSP